MSSTRGKRFVVGSIDGLSVVTGVIAGLCVVVMMLMIVLDVCRRQISGAAIPGVLEYAEVLMVFVVYFSIGYAQKTGNHVVVDLVVQQLPRRISDALNVVVLVAVGIFLLWVTYETAHAAVRSYSVGEYRFGLTQVPVWPARVAIPIGFFAMAMQCFLQAWQARRIEWRPPSPPLDVDVAAPLVARKTEV